MQDNKTWRQLNLPEVSTYIEFPIAFTGKPPKGSKATVFTGLLLSCGFVLAIIHTINKICGEPAEITYKYVQDRFGIYPETFSAALRELEKRKIIERVGRSKYKIIEYYSKHNYVEIDDYLFKKEFYEVYETSAGQQTEKVKTLPYSRILCLAFLKRGNENPKTHGEFISSQKRIGKAINLPNSTAGDTLRELNAASLMRAEKLENHDKSQRNCSKYTVNPEVLAVKHPKRVKAEAVNDAYKADELHKRLMLDTEYKGLIERINVNAEEYMAELRLNGLNVTPEIEKLEEDTAELREELDRYFVVHNVDRTVFPPGFFKCDITEYDQF